MKKIILLFAFLICNQLHADYIQFQINVDPCTNNACSSYSVTTADCQGYYGQGGLLILTANLGDANACGIIELAVDITNELTGVTVRTLLEIDINADFNHFDISTEGLGSVTGSNCCGPCPCPYPCPCPSECAPVIIEINGMLFTFSNVDTSVPLTTSMSSLSGSPPQLTSYQWQMINAGYAEVQIDANGNPVLVYPGNDNYCPEPCQYYGCPPPCCPPPCCP